MKPLLFTKLRNVKSPNRANPGDAGIDFYIPIDLTANELLQVGKSTDRPGVNQILYSNGLIDFYEKNDELYVSLHPMSRILIPSGIRVLIDPKESMLMAANKSGVATKDGLLYTAEIVDSPYTGEVHIGIFNATNTKKDLNLAAGKKIMQFIHVPVILSTPVEITNANYEELAKDWGTRGAAGFGSTDNK